MHPPILALAGADVEDTMEEYIGTIKLFAGNYAPKGWLKCEGQILEIRWNAALFAILGIQFGGDGITTFALPDLRDARPHPDLTYIMCVQGVFPPRE
jgi:microcystin-dependent protein